MSPDGRAIALVARRPGETSRLWLQQLDGERSVPLQGTEGASAPFWSADGEWLAFYAGGSLKRVRRTGGEPQTITATKATGSGGSAWSAADTILFKSGRFEAPWLSVPEKRFPSSGPFRVGSPSVSPDGQWIAYVTDASGRPEVWLAAYPSGEMRVQVSRTGGFMPEWRANDGRELYYLSLDQRLMAVTVEPKSASLSAGPPTELLHLPEMVPHAPRSYAPTADGRRFLVETLAPGVRQPPIQVIVNWQALLKK